MMFYVLCAALCLSVLFVMTAGASAVCPLAARLLSQRFENIKARTAANLLFSVRILPFVAACIVAFGFVLPAFLKLEPRSTTEGMSLKLAALALAGAGLIVTLAVRMARSLRATAHVERDWRGRSQELQIAGFRARLYCVEGTFPFLAVTGLLRPRVYVGRSIVELLSPAEMQAALAHEMAHVRSFDNLKQLLLKSLRWTGSFENLTGASSIWVHASEAAADEEAVAGGALALDLSAALVKMGRVSRGYVSGAQILASQFTPYAAASSLPTRIARLEQWLEDGPPVVKVHSLSARTIFALSLAAGILAYAATINAILPWIHEALELLVR
jgi:Zn-dependent protease with chaperone function